jgi:hypothetical protein
LGEGRSCSSSDVYQVCGCWPCGICGRSVAVATLTAPTPRAPSTTAEGVDGEWRVLDHTDLAELIQLAKAADVAMLGQYPGDDSDGATWLRPDDLMIEIGRPVLVVPYAGTFERVGRWVLVAWDSTS